jgi:hypothetical protein
MTSGTIRVSQVRRRKKMTVVVEFEVSASRTSETSLS